MQEKLLKHRKQWYLPLGIAAGISVLFMGGWLLLGRSLTDRSLESALDPISPAPLEGAKLAPATPVPQPLASLPPTPALPAAKLDPATPPAVVKLKPATSEAPTIPNEGVLRVSNATSYPVRLALLIKKKKTADAYELPAHWDFEPGEGSNQGLLLSLPNRTLRLSKGDVLVAFAQDGSRRYWGPYVVGETPMPTWDAANQEWQLTLQP